MFEKLKPHPIKALIWKKRANGYVLEKDKARFIEERMGRRYFHFRKHGIRKPIPQEFMSGDGKIYAYSDGENIIPIKMDFSKIYPNTPKGERSPEMDTWSEDIRFWVSQEFREADNKYRGEEGFWSKYGSIIAPAIILIGAGIFFFILFRAQAEVLGQMKEAASALAGGMKGGAGGW